MNNESDAAYLLAIDTITTSNYALKIKGPTKDDSLLKCNPIVINFDSTEWRDFSESPYLSFIYKTDSIFTLRVGVVTYFDTTYEAETRKIFAINEWLEFSDSIKVPTDSLKRIKAVLLYLNSDASSNENRNLSIDNISFGTLASPYEFKIIRPIKGSMFSTSDSIKVFTNAGEGYKLIIKVNNNTYTELTSVPYITVIKGLEEGYYTITAQLCKMDNTVVHQNETSFIIAGENGFTYRNEATEYLFNSLKAISKSDFTMFGVANGLTINYKYGPRHAFNDKSDCKDITGSHPAFIESDFMWYDGDKTFMTNDTIAMREAYKRGIITGYCFHLRGLHSNSFYAFNNNVLTADKDLVKEILASNDRSINASLNWYLSKLDKLVIPILKGLGFPIIFRPFHEMTGNWFWWGTATCTADEYIALYRLTVNYLKANGVNNVLYAWAPDKSSDMSRYPGDNYVDVLGYDGYEIGVASYHSISTFTYTYGKVVDYALSHDKIVAVTETGYGSYPGTHYDYWNDHVLIPMKKHSKAKHAAWVMSWYNADWNNDNTGTSWIPYIGIEEKTNGDKAIENFIKFYNDPRTIFASDIPYLYKNNDTTAFVYPQSMTIMVNDSVTLIGGSKANWFNEAANWSSSNINVATIDETGKLKAISAGNAIITMISANGSIATCSVSVINDTKVSAINNSNIILYPNPVNNGIFYIDLKNSFSGKSKIKIFNIDGKCMQELISFDRNIKISCSNLSAGIYNVTIETKDRTADFKIVIK